MNAHQLNSASVPFHRKAIALLILFGMLVYCNSFTKAFVFDDNVWIRDNPDIKYPSVFLESLQGRIVGAITFLANYEIFGLKPPGYHAVNLAIHLFAGLALFGLVRRTLLLDRWQGRFNETASQYAFVVALIWLVHPLQTQSVTYIIQRFESLMGMFFLLTFYCFIRAAQSPHRSAGWFSLSVICCALGMGTKEVMAVAPAVLVIYDWIFLAKSWRDLVKKRWIFYVALAALWSGYLAMRILPGVVATDQERTTGFGIPGITPYQYALSQLAVIAHYLYLSFWPIGLSLDYIDWPVAQTWTEVILPGLIILTLVCVTFWGLLRKSWIGFAGIWFFFILAPTSSIMPIRDLAFEHRMYLPLAAVVVVAVFGADWLSRFLATSFRISAGTQKAITVVVVTIVITLLSVRTFIRNEDYRSPEAIWSDVIAKRPNPARAYISYGIFARAKDADEAIDYLRKGAQLMPRYYLVHHYIALNLWDRGTLDEAHKHFDLAVRYSPSFFEGSLLMRGMFHLVENKPTLAVADFEAAIEANPRRATGYFNLGRALMAMGKTADAEKAYAKGLRLDPDWARKADQSAKKIVYSEEPSKHLLSKAILFAKQANEITDANNPEYLLTLADAYEATDELPSAIATAERAESLATDSGDVYLAAMAQRKLKRYTESKKDAK